MISRNRGKDVGSTGMGPPVELWPPIPVGVGRRATHMQATSSRTRTNVPRTARARARARAPAPAPAPARTPVRGWTTPPRLPLLPPPGAVAQEPPRAAGITASARAAHGLTGTRAAHQDAASFDATLACLNMMIAPAVPYIRNYGFEPFLGVLRQSQDWANPRPTCLHQCHRACMFITVVRRVNVSAHA